MHRQGGLPFHAFDRLLFTSPRHQPPKPTVKNETMSVSRTRAMNRVERERSQQSRVFQNLPEAWIPPNLKSFPKTLKQSGGQVLPCGYV